jgi:5-hydroxyisourate hydrolase
MKMGRLSTHILDTYHGKPASGVKIDLKTEDGRLIKTVITNQDGRTDEPLMLGESYKAGKYTLFFHIGDYFKAKGVTLATPAFLDIVPIAFGMAEADGHYHVPLVCSPYTYSTYRGS